MTKRPTARKAAAQPRRRGWRWALIFAAVVALALATLAGANFWVLWRGGRHVFYNQRALPANDVGLVLGTSPRLSTGGPNPFFAGRIAAAAELYHAGKVKHLLLSGDNRARNYDEPSEMRDALRDKGVPVRAMTLDYAGLRTLDSLVRARKVFGLQTLTVITDDFHAPRAVFLGRHFGIAAVGFPSRRVPFSISKKTRLREVGSRIAACLDVYLLHTAPRHLGPRETISVR